MSSEVVPARCPFWRVSFLLSTCTVLFPLVCGLSLNPSFQNLPRQLLCLFFLSASEFLGHVSHSIINHWHSPHVLWFIQNLRCWESLLSPGNLSRFFSSLVTPRAWHVGGTEFVFVDLMWFNIIENAGQSHLEMTQSAQNATKGGWSESPSGAREPPLGTPPGPCCEVLEFLSKAQ